MTMSQWSREVAADMIAKSSKQDRELDRRHGGERVALPAALNGRAISPSQKWSSKLSVWKGLENWNEYVSEM